MVLRVRTDLESGVTLLVICILVPLVGGSTVKEEVILWVESSLGGGWSVWEQSQRVSWISKARHLRSETLRKWRESTIPWRDNGTSHGYHNRWGSERWSAPNYPPLGESKDHRPYCHKEYGGLSRPAIGGSKPLTSQGEYSGCATNDVGDSKVRWSYHQQSVGNDRHRRPFWGQEVVGERSKMYCL